MGLRFERPPLEDLYAHFRQQVLAKQDVHAGMLTLMMFLAWMGRLVWSGSAALLLRQPALLRPAAYSVSCLAPAALVLWRGRRWYTRRRARVILALRLLHLAMAAGLQSNLEPLVVSTDCTEPVWRTIGRLLVACRLVPLLMSCLGFQTSPATSAALQAASAAIVLQHVCNACASPFMQRPGPQDNLTSICGFLGTGPSLTPTAIPAVNFPAGADPCLWLVVWVLGCWLFLLPILLVVLMDARARREFVLSLPPGTLPPAERASWLALSLPAPCLAALIGMPPLAMSLWRIGALALEAAYAQTNPTN